MLQRTSQLHASDWPCLSSSFGEMLVAATEAIKFSRRLWIEDCWFQTSFSWLKRVSEKWCGLVKIPGRSSASNSDCYSYSKSTDSLLQWSPFVHEVLFIYITRVYSWVQQIINCEICSCTSTVPQQPHTRVALFSSFMNPHRKAEKLFLFSNIILFPISVISPCLPPTF